MGTASADASVKSAVVRVKVECPGQIGSRVKRRDEDWVWKNQDVQDGGPGLGTIVERRPMDGWVGVKWDNGREHNYRAGIDGKYDLEYAQVAEPADDGDHCKEALTRIWEAPDFADCEVVCNGRTFQCHRVVLAQASPVFKQMLSGEMLEAKRQRIQLEALETETEAASAFLEFVYTGVLDCNSQHFPTVAKLADFYQLECITGKTCNSMVNGADASNVVPIARLFKNMRKKPRVEPYLTKLVDKVKQSSELTLALMSAL